MRSRFTRFVSSQLPTRVQLHYASGPPTALLCSYIRLGRIDTPTNRPGPALAQPSDATKLVLEGIHIDG